MKDGLKWSDSRALGQQKKMLFSQLKLPRNQSTVKAPYTSAFAKLLDMKVDGNVLTTTLINPMRLWPMF